MNSNMYKLATSGSGMAAVAAGKYWLGCRAGWKDTSMHEVEINPPGGGVWGLLKLVLGEQPEPDCNE